MRSARHGSRVTRRLLAALLLLPGVASGQSNLGGGPALPPPQATAPAPSQSPPPTAPAVAPRPSRPPLAAPAPPAAPAVTRPSPPAATPAPRVATPAPGTARPTQGRPTQGRTAGPPAAAQARRPQRAPATAAGAAAGAAAIVPPRPAEPPSPPAPRTGSATGLPLPRYAALGSNQVNLRVGPDLRYPIEWTYQRRDLPVQIVDEHQQWRRIRDPDGTEGWVQRPLLHSRRTFVIAGTEERSLRRGPEEAAAPVARLKPGVVGRLRRCAEREPWCEAEVGGYRGWLKRAEIWGVAADEAVQ